LRHALQDGHRAEGFSRGPILGIHILPDMRGMGMNAFGQMTHNDVLRVKLEVLRREHRDLDEAIAALEQSARGDHLTLRRLKKQKLMLKDRISAIEDQLLPDIIA
jgi:hypothetical protein